PRRVANVSWSSSRYSGTGHLGNGRTVVLLALAPCHVRLAPQGHVTGDAEYANNVPILVAEGHLRPRNREHSAVSKANPIFPRHDRTTGADNFLILLGELTGEVFR